MEKDPNVCCPRFDPTPWSDKVLNWKDKHFIKGRVRTFFFIPLNFGSAITRLMKQVDTAKAGVPENLCLSDHTSKWNMDILLGVDKEVPGADNITLNGQFYSRVYEGDFNQTGTWCADFTEKAAAKGFKVDKWYMWYTTCPKCAKKYGHNYTVIIAQVK